MNNKTISAGVGVLVVIVAAIAAYTAPRSAGNKMPQRPAQQGAATSTVQGPAPAAASYTAAQVATHKDASSCWTSINGNVYDVTPWINQHPGGAAAILSLCGKDGSSAFNGQHGGQRRPEQELAGFQIGTLSK